MKSRKTVLMNLFQDNNRGRDNKNWPVDPEGEEWGWTETVASTHIHCGCARAQSCPAICNLMARLLCPCNFPTRNTGMGCHFLHQGIFPIQGSNSCPGSSVLAGGVFTTGTTRETHMCHTMCHVLSHFSHVQLCATPWPVAPQAPLSMGFSRQEHWSGSPCPPPEGLSNPGMETLSLMSRAIADRFFATSATWEVLNYIHNHV